MAFVDYYSILGIPKTATAKEIKAAYRKLARKFHPDLNPDNKESELKFKEINEANEVLSNPDSRKKYDEYGQNWKHGEEFESVKRRGSRQASNQSHHKDFSQEEYSDFFESMFGEGRTSYRQKPKFKGQDYNAELQLNLKDVYTSQQQILTVNGKKIRLTIPAGVEHGQVIKIKGKGGAGVNSGPNGDLYIKFNITNNTNFKRIGQDLHQVIDLDLYTAILGGDMTVDTFDGKVKLQIKPGTKNESKVKLKGKGFPIYKSENNFGDLYISYKIDIPTNLKDREIALFKELQKIRRS